MFVIRQQQYHAPVHVQAPINGLALFGNRPARALQDGTQALQSFPAALRHDGGVAKELPSMLLPSVLLQIALFLD